MAARLDIENISIIKFQEVSECLSLDVSTGRLVSKLNSNRKETVRRDCE